MKMTGRSRTTFFALLVGVRLAAAPHYTLAQSVNFAGAQTTILSGLNGPEAVAVDAAGDVFIADTGNNRVVEVPVGGCPAAGCPTVGSNLGLAMPAGVAVDAAGNVYIADTGNNRVVKVTAGGVEGGLLGSLSSPTGVAVDSSGNVYVADSGHHQVVEIGGAGVDFVNLFNPTGVAVNAAGNVFVVDNGFHAVERQLPAGCGESGGLCIIDQNLNGPFGVAVDGVGNVFIGDTGNNRVVELPGNGSAPTTIGSNLAGPYGVAVDAAGNVYIADTGNGRVVEVQPYSVNFGSLNVCPSGQTTPAPCNQTLTLNFNITASGTLGTPNVLTLGSPNLDFTLASGSTCTGSVTAGGTCSLNITFAPSFPGLRTGAVQLVDGSGNILATTLIYGTGVAPQVAFSPGVQSTITTSGLQHPASLAVDAAGDIFVASGDTVYEIPAGGGAQTTIASGFSYVSGVGLDGAGNVVVSDANAGAVYKVLAGGGAQTTIASGFNYISGVALDGAGNVLVADSGAGKVYRVPANGSAQTTVGSGFHGPQAVAVDAAGDVFVVDNTAKVYKVPADGSAQITIGSGFTRPTGVAVDAAGDVYIADAGAQKVYKVPADGSAQTTIGSGFSSPYGIAVDSAGNVYIADSVTGQVFEENFSQPPSFDFGEQAFSDCCATQSVTIENVGNAKLIEAGLSFAGDPDFAIQSGGGIPPDCNATTSLTPGAGCNLSIYFDPGKAASRGGAATLTNNSLNARPATQVIALSGAGIQFPITLSFNLPNSVPALSSLSPRVAVFAPEPDGSGDLIFTGYFSVSPSSICSTDGTSVTFLMPGTCAITANQPANPPGYNAGCLTKSITVTPAPTEQITIGTNIAGLSFTVDGTAYTGTTTVTWSAGSTHTISTTSPQTTATGTQYAFSAWNDGGAISHSVTAPSSAATYTATFNAQYQLTTSASPAAGGSVTPATGYFTAGTVVTLQATPNSGYVFSKWTGAAVANANSASTTITLTAAAAVTANFLTLPTHFAVSAPSTATVGVPFNFTVTALDANNNPTTTYAGTVHFASTDSLAMLPANGALTNGSGTFTATLKDAGSQTITATDTVNGTLTGTSGAIMVGPAPQTITFTGLPATATYGSAGPYMLNGTASLSLPVSYSVTGPATLSGSTLTITGAGSVTVTASQAGNANYQPATPVTQTVVVSTDSQTITFTGLPPTATYGSAGPYTLNGTATLSLPVSYSVTGPATLSGSTLTITGAGTVAVTASQAGNANYQPATPVTQSIIVNAESQTITFTGLPATATYGSAGPYTLNGTATLRLPVSYSVSGPATLSGSTLTIIGAGTVTVTASQAGNVNYRPATPVTQTIIVSAESQTITFGAIAAQTVGTPLTLSATATSGLTVGFASMTTGVCMVAGTTATFLGAGTCTIQASQAGNANYLAAASVSQTFTVKGRPQTITFGAIAVQTVGTPLTLSAAASSGLAVAFSSNTTAVCMVSGTTATFLTSGTCTIQATQPGNTIYAAATPVSQSFTVNGKPQTITFKLPASQLQGTPLALTATATSALPVTFTSLTPAICTISGTTATLAHPGTCTIQASQAGNPMYAAAPTVSQSLTVIAAFTITPSPSSETVLVGTLGAFTLQLQQASGFTGKVTLSCAGPAGSYCTNFPMTVSFVNGKALAVSAIFFPLNTPPGSYTVTFTGVSSAIMDSATATFIVKGP